MTIGAMMRAARLAAGMRQVDVAAKMGITRAVVSKFERNQDMLPRARALQFCRVVQCDPVPLLLALAEFHGYLEVPWAPGAPAAMARLAVASATWKDADFCTVTWAHDEAMRLVDCGDIRGALDLERRAAEAEASEPSRSILHRSAAWLALEAGDPGEAARSPQRGFAVPAQSWPTNCTT